MTVAAFREADGFGHFFLLIIGAYFTGCLWQSATILIMYPLTQFDEGGRGLARDPDPPGLWCPLHRGKRAYVVRRAAYTTGQIRRSTNLALKSSDGADVTVQETMHYKKQRLPDRFYRWVIRCGA